MTNALKNGVPIEEVVFGLQCCGNCSAWLQTTDADPRNGLVGGICRAGPPTPFIMQGPPHPLDPQKKSSLQVTSQFPPMQNNGWCRDGWEPRENPPEGPIEEEKVGAPT